MKDFEYLCISMKQALYLTIICVVLGIAACTTESDRMRMRAGLDSINVRNRTGQPFTVADVQPYVTFFDEHGTPNDRLLAHNLLGLAYYDHGEAPMALQCYQEAIDCADTAASDCDYAQLARVYGQMADVFYYQGLYRQQLEHQKKAVEYTRIGKDTFAGLMSYEQMYFAYMGLKDTASAISVIEEVAKKYLELGYASDAAISYGLNIKPLIEKGDYNKAREFIKRYETESGRFDEHGNITKGHEAYYNIKGLLFLKEHHLDSAEYWYRKELSMGKDLNNQNGGSLGLAMVYNQRHQLDSATKYYQYAYTINDSVYARRTTKEVERMQAMYDYTRFQEISQKESQRADRMKRILETAGTLVVILSLLTYIIIIRINRKREDAISKYRNSLLLIEQAQYDIAKLQSEEEDSQSLIAEKEKTIESLRVELLRYQQSKAVSNHSHLEKMLKESDEYNTFLKLSRKGQVPTEEEWQHLHVKLYELFPDFHQLLISKRHLLNKNEFNACFLIRLHFKPSDLMNMLNISSSYSNKIRKNMLGKLFNSDGKAEEFDEKIANLF